MIGVFLFGGILLLLGSIVVLSVIRGRPEPDAADPSPARRRDAAIDALRELEFEYRTDKVGEAEYRALRRRLASEAVRARSEAEGAATPEVEARARPGCDGCGATLEPEARFCPACGRGVTPDRELNAG